MHSTRISIARLLALEVPLAWQDAVAVVHEIAMLNDVTAVMNNRPPLVGPDTCFLTRTGEVELPETTDTESPEAVGDLLRLLLAGREAPAALEDLAFGRHSRDLTTDLAAFSVGNRRAVIARLATHALSVADGTVANAPKPRPGGAAGPAEAAGRDAGAGHAPVEAARPVLVKSSPARLAVETIPAGAAVVVPPPFQASPRPLTPPAPPPPPRDPRGDGPPADDHAVGTPGRWSARPPASAAPTPAPAPASTTGTDLELRRLRQRQHERARTPRRWPPRVLLLLRRLGRLVTWRPATPNPLVIGASIVLVAAVASVLWRRTTPKPGAANPAARLTLPTGATASPGAPVVLPAGAGIPPPSSSPPSAGAAAAPLVQASANPPVSAAPPATSAASGLGPTTALIRSRPTLIVRRTTPVPEAAIAAASPADVGAPPASTTPTPSPDGDRPTASVPPPAVARATPAPAVPPPAVPGVRGRATLYSSDDADVEPPVMRRQHLPSSVLEPTAEAPDDWPFLEILIDVQGAVEQVRLHARQLAPGQTLYRHRMLLAAAKAWQFEPARRNGEPVRYVMRVPLEP